MEIFNTALAFISEYGPMATAVALILAVSQSIASRKQYKKLYELSDKYEEIKRNISTQYKGEFPHFLPAVLDLIGDATKSIEIACDYPAFSIYSQREMFLKYRETLNKKIEELGRDNLKIKICYPNESIRRELTRKQFKIDNPGVKCTTLKKETSNLQRFFSQDGDNRNFEQLSFADINDLFIIQDKRFIDFFGNRIEFVEENISFKLYYWIIDDEKAIFSIPSVDDYDSDQGFFTSEVNLITAIKKLYRADS